jgi:hypothetical protein
LEEGLGSATGERGDGSSNCLIRRLGEWEVKGVEGRNESEYELIYIVKEGPEAQ